MQGTMLVMQPNGEVKVTKLDRVPELEDLKAGIGGGYLEKVPGFNVYVDMAGAPHRAVMLCDEDGKRKHLPLNPPATRSWQQSLKMQGHPGLIEAKTGRVVDFIVGPVVILYGDRKFMESL